LVCGASKKVLLNGHLLGIASFESYNLIERGLAWRDGTATEPAFLEMLREIRAQFPSL
jgi:hypothetical protein